jgi:hypothetical protein
LRNALELLLTNEAHFRAILALRMRTFGSELVGLGVLGIDEYVKRCELLGPEMVVEECYWTNFGGLRGEIDIYMPNVRVAIEAKVVRRQRVNFEEVIGQALRDLTNIVVDRAFIAVPLPEVPGWVRDVCALSGVGILGLSPPRKLSPASRRVLVLLPPSRSRCASTT